jgi:hypothetical protein
MGSEVWAQHWGSDKDEAAGLINDAPVGGRAEFVCPTCGSNWRRNQTALRLLLDEHAADGTPIDTSRQ